MWEVSTISRHWCCVCTWNVCACGHDIHPHDAGRNVRSFNRFARQIHCGCQTLNSFTGEKKAAGLMLSLHHWHTGRDQLPQKSPVTAYYPSGAIWLGWLQLMSSLLVFSAVNQRGAVYGWQLSATSLYRSQDWFFYQSSITRLRFLSPNKTLCFCLGCRLWQEDALVTRISEEGWRTGFSYASKCLILSSIYLSIIRM